MNIFLKFPIIRNSTFWMSAQGFPYFQLSFCEGSTKWNFCLLLWNHLLIEKLLPAFRSPPVPLKFFWNPPVILKIFTKAGYECTLEQIDQWEQRKSWTKIWCGFRKKTFRISKCFQRNKQQLHFYFRTKQTKNLKKTLAHVKKLRFKFIGLQKKYSSGDIIPWILLDPQNKVVKIFFGWFSFA